MPSALPHAYVISLPEDAHRRERLTGDLRKCGIGYTVVDAIDGRGFDVRRHPAYDRKKRHRYFGRDLLGAELGCLLSHKQALENLLESDRPNGLIFEDDAVLRDHFSACIAGIAALDPPAELVRFIDKEKLYRTRHKTIATLPANISLARTLATPGGAYAYFITRNGAQKLLSCLQKIYLPVDIVIGHSWVTGVDNLIAIPSPVTHAHLADTNIGDQRFDKTVTLTGVERALYPITRAGFKLKEGIMKRIHFVRRNRTDRATDRYSI